MKRSRAKRHVTGFASRIAGGARSLLHAMGRRLAGGATHVRAGVAMLMRNGGGWRALALARDADGFPTYASRQSDVTRDPQIDEIIDDRNETVVVEGYQYEPSETLYNNDPVAYRDKMLELRDTRRPDPAA